MLATVCSLVPCGAHFVACEDTPWAVVDGLVEIASADEFLPAGVGEAGGFNAERCCDFVHGCVEILGHFGERVVFEGLVFSEGIVTGAGVVFGVMSDFVASGVGGFPGFEATWEWRASSKERERAALLPFGEEKGSARHEIIGTWLKIF